MGMMKEFKDFAMRGNVVDMAVGIIIGGAFGKIVSSLVNNVIMPPIGAMMGGVDFSDLKIQVKEAVVANAAEGVEAAEAVTINYGMFINTVLDFIIVAFCIFMIIRAMNKLKKEEPAKAPTTRDCPACFSAISLKATRCPQCTSEVPA